MKTFAIAFIAATATARFSFGGLKSAVKNLMHKAHKGHDVLDNAEEEAQ